LAFLALCDKYVEDKSVLDYDKFDKDNTIDNLGAAFKLAEQHLGVPQLLDPQEVSEGNVDERSLVLYISLYFHAFVAKQQQRLVLEEKERIEAEMRGLQGSLEDRAKMAVQLQETNEKLRLQLEQLQRDLDAERLTSTNLRDEVARLKEELEEERKKNASLHEKSVSLEGQVHNLEGQVSELTSKFETESTQRASQTEKFNAQSKVQTSGLAVLKKNLEQHIDDLHRWQKYLDFDKSVEIDFTEARVDLLTQISQENFDEQLRVLTDKLDKENGELHSLLKAKEAEAKARKETEKKKKERQQVSSVL
jgi:cortexillin 1/2